jgi:DNA invertase Pin-like site-specific DNA recombinase
MLPNQISSHTSAKVVLGIEVHFVKENFILSDECRSSEKFMHGIKVLMVKGFIDNLSEEATKGMAEKARQGLWPSVAPFGYARVSTRDREREGYSIPAQVKLLEDYAALNGLIVASSHVDVETARKAGRTAFGIPLRNAVGRGSEAGVLAVHGLCWCDGEGCGGVVECGARIRRGSWYV